MCYPISTFIVEQPALKQAVEIVAVFILGIAIPLVPLCFPAARSDPRTHLSVLVPLFDEHVTLAFLPRTHIFSFISRFDRRLRSITRSNFVLVRLAMAGMPLVRVAGVEPVRRVFLVGGVVVLAVGDAVEVELALDFGILRVVEHLASLGVDGACVGFG